MMKKCTTILLLVLISISTFAQLFQKYSGNPVFNIGSGQPTWRSLHVANATILTPSETPDGKWRMFLRGSGNNPDGYHDNIGMFDQNASSFNPYGGWQEYSGNPNLPHGSTYDGLHVLDAAALKGGDGNIYLYYMGRDNNNTSSLCGAYSTNGGFSFTKFSNNPLKLHVGPNDVVYDNGQYYTFYGDAKWNGSGFNEKLQIWVSVTSQPDQVSSSPSYAIRTGSNGSYDDESVNGAKIFKVSGDSRWFMIYQTSGAHFDYPDRFHAAYSNDLVNWTKVNNSIPLLTRGALGQWDQGAIWTGGVFEHNGRLFMYYEGWGAFNTNGNRNNVYYPEGSSRVGVASVKTGDFLNWVNANNPAVSSITSGSIYRIINRNSGKSLEIAGESLANEAILAQWDYWGGGNQHFKVESVGSGYYRITPVHSNKCLDVYGWSTANEGKVVQWDWAGGNNQQWSITHLGSNYFSVINRHSNKGLDVYGWSTANGAKVVQWDYVGGENQQWQFILVNNGGSARTSTPLVESSQSEEDLVDEEDPVSVYPNPTGDFIYVKLGSYTSTAKAELISSNGVSLMSEEVNSKPDILLDVKDITKSGLYILRITKDNQQTVHKVSIIK